MLIIGWVFRGTANWRWGAVLSALMAALVSLSPQTADAAGGLVVTPQLVELDSRQRNKVLTLANRGEEAETYRISIINYRMDSAGNLHPTDTPSAQEGFAAGLFRYAPRQITLEPGKPQTVRILYRRPAGLEEGEYRSHLLFQQVPKATAVTTDQGAGSGLSLQIQTVFGVTIPVIVRHGQLEASGTLTELRATEIGGAPGVTMRIARSGSRSLRGDLVATAGGQEIGRLNNVAVYLSTDFRDIAMPLNSEQAKAAAGREIMVEYRPRGDSGAPAIASGSIMLR